MREMMNQTDMEKTMLVFKSGGFFREGRWITPQLMMAEQRGITQPQSRFEMITHNAIPIFRQGACTGYRDEISVVGTFTQDQVEQILIDTEELSELACKTEIRSIT